MYSGKQEDNLHIMTYTLNSGVKGTVPLSAAQIGEWLDSYRSNTKFVTEIGKEFFGLNPELVADFKVQNVFSSYREVVLPKQQEVVYNRLSEEFKKNSVWIHIDCKCGTTYTTESPYYRTKWYCTKCKEIVFLDKKKPPVKTNKGDAHYMTNKYLVERD
ncbi:hypothetical protein EJP77_07310 [Paenibacillus zeisoli]|uniref:Uncharacterized protein n=1 Tax=Paenibacillus zeisoli TaxID=2496267 RepID=A0A3S1BU60_9BACL|nr:hypothetical protein [Paenibacillus zeisoli]RUT33449.1 hypothetical protein EJP77_07310 [Paenibacillus zeisoli]